MVQLIVQLRKFLTVWKQKHRCEDKAVSIAEHLAALKHALVAAVLIVFLAFCFTFVFSKSILNWLLSVAEGCGYSMVFLSPQEILIQQLRIAGISALLFGSPLVFMCVYSFVKVALSKKERVAIVCLCTAAYVLFWCGMLFAQKLAYPLILQFFTGVNAGYSVTSAVSVEGYVTLAITVFTIFGCVTELPVCCIVLALAGALSYETMRKMEKPAIVLMFVVGAVITPPDVVSQLLVAVPLTVLYKVSEVLVWLCWRMGKREKK